jgi:hypothetical protein
LVNYWPIKLLIWYSRLSLRNNLLKIDSFYLSSLRSCAFNFWIKKKKKKMNEKEKLKHSCIKNRINTHTHTNSHSWVAQVNHDHDRQNILFNLKNNLFKGQDTNIHIESVLLY